MRLIVGLSGLVPAVMVSPCAAISPLWPERNAAPADRDGTALRACGISVRRPVSPYRRLPMPGHGFLLPPEQTIAPVHDSPSTYRRRRSRRLGSGLATGPGRAEGTAQRDAGKRRNDARAPDGRPGRTGVLEQLPVGRRGEQCGRPAPCGDAGAGFA